MSVKRMFFKYVPQNILGMVGISLYILADTFFIAQAVGADGITALNLVLPIYSLIFAIGVMIGVGSAIRYAVASGKGDGRANGYFFNAIFWGTVIGLIFMILGLFFPGHIIAMLGGDATIVEVGCTYTRIFMGFAPFFIWNHICNAFVRNDGAPGIAMAATLFSSLFNIVGDYVLMFPLGMGMPGAALATALSPILGVLICCIHLCSKKSSVSLKPVMPSLKKLFYSCQVGVAAFVGEISSGVTTALFNVIILKLAGNTGVAAYGVVANTALVAVAMFNGVSQGTQPIVSLYYGRNEHKNILKTFSMAIVTALVLAVLMLGVVWIWTEPIAGIFNKESDAVLAAYAHTGLRLYFIGFLFAGINIVGAGVLSAMEAAKGAFISSIMRGFVAIIICAVVMSWLFDMNGVWLSFAVAEAITMLVTVAALNSVLKKDSHKKFQKL